jgi:hypothetical protein
MTTTNVSTDRIKLTYADLRAKVKEDLEKKNEWNLHHLKGGGFPVTDCKS